MLGGPVLKKLPSIVVAGLAVAVAGTAYAASRNTHVMNVSLPDGSVAHVQYVGDVPPKVTVDPAAVPRDLWTMSAFPDFAGFDRMFRQMDQQMRQVEQMARQPVGTPNMNVASYGNLPAGANSVTIVSYSNGGSTCTRRTEVVSEGAGKAPKVTSSVSGNCAASAQPAPQAAPKPTALDRT
jgi:hypothetical protein